MPTCAFDSRAFSSGFQVCAPVADDRTLRGIPALPRVRKREKACADLSSFLLVHTFGYGRGELVPNRKQRDEEDIIAIAEAVARWWFAKRDAERREAEYHVRQAQHRAAYTRWWRATQPQVLACRECDRDTRFSWSKVGRKLVCETCGHPKR